MSDDQPVHGTSIAIDGRGVLITGAAGAGKTTLALELIRRARTGDVEAGLVADDRTIVTAESNALMLRCPAPLAGKIELRGYGIADAADIAVAQAELALVVELVPTDQAVRFAEGETMIVADRPVARLAVPEGPAPSAAGAVLAALGLPLSL